MSEAAAGRASTCAFLRAFARSAGIREQTSVPWRRSLQGDPGKTKKARAAMLSGASPCSGPRRRYWLLPEQLPATWRTDVTCRVCPPAMLPELIEPLLAVLPVIEPVDEPDEPVEPAVDDGVLDDGVLADEPAVDPVGAVDPVRPLSAGEPAVLPAP